MATELLARGQATITALSDAYTIVLSPTEYIFPVTSEGTISSAITVSCEVQVTQGDVPVSAFTIGAPVKPAGFTSINVDNAGKRVIFFVAAGTTILAEHGKIIVPITIADVDYFPAFIWSMAKAGTEGTPGKPGADANMLDWVKEWNNNKTEVNGNHLITPKIFAGVRHSSGTISGTAIGRFVLLSRNSSGQFQSEEVNGVYGFSDGNRTFSIDTSGSVMLGRGDESIRYDAQTGKISFGASVTMQWIGATYIDKNGIFTGTLSAGTISAVRIDASQITTGKIGAQHIDVASLKATLLTAGNIEALTLNVTHGKIGGWTIDADSVFRGTKNNTPGSFTPSTGSVTLGSNGLRGFKWRLDATGAGSIAGGNIAWDAAGNVTFSEGVTLQWSRPIDAITSALGGEDFPKLTKITGDGIYTGNLTADQITTGTLSADRIAAGSLSASKLDANSIRADLINADYISGLNCSFKFGQIGGWRITFTSIYNSNMMLSSSDRCLMVYSADGTSGHRVKMFYNTDSDFGFSATNSLGKEVLRLGSINRIAGWDVTTDTITKGSVSLGADGSISNTTKWKLNRDGSGQLASGNISWDAAGVVTFASSVSLNWATPINSITEALGGATYPKLTKITSEGIYTGNLSAQQISTGTLSADRLDAAGIQASIINTEYINGLECTFTKGTIGGWSINTDSIIGGTRDTGRGFVRIALNATLSDSEEDWLDGNCLPMGSSMIWSTPENEGHLVIGQVAELNHRTKKGYIGIQMINRSQEYFCLSAKIGEISGPETCNRIAGWSFDYERIWKNSVSLGANGSISNGTKWQMNNDGSGRIAAGNISWDAAGNVTFTSSVSIAWTAGVDAISTALGGATYPKLTQITATGIYTGKISAAQISVDSTLVVGGSSYSGSISVRDGANNIKATLDRNGITAVGGKIGGWIINNETICAAAPASGHRIYLTSSGYMYNDNPNTGKDYWGLKPDGSATFGYGTTSFSKDGSGFLAGGNLSWDAAGNLIGKDATLEDIFMTGTFRSPFVAYDGSIIIGGGSSEAELHDNLTMPGGGGWILSSDFPWDATQNGRTVTIVNYKYNGNITTGKMQLSAPTGKYFFEDGLLKSSILLSREYVLLKGYGEGANFYGWIVMHRGDIGTVSKYGSCAKVMYQGWVENGVIRRYKSFDGGKLTCSKTATGTYEVSFPTSVSIPINDYTVMITGSNIIADTTNQIYASLTAKTTTGFVVKTADDSSRNNASFTFQVISMADWS